MRSSCSTSSDCPANLPALCTLTMWPSTSAPLGITTSPSTASGESSVAWKVCPCWLFSESTVSTRRTASVVPVGMVTFAGGGGGGGACGAAGAAAADEAGAAGAAASSATSWCFTFGLAAGAGLLGGGGGGGACSAWTGGGGAGGVDCRLLITCLTPGTDAA